MDRLYEAICRHTDARGLLSRAAVMVLYAMAAEGVTYEEARNAYAEWIGEPPERLQADLCYDILRAGYEVPPAKLFAEIIKQEDLR